MPVTASNNFAKVLLISGLLVFGAFVILVAIDFYRGCDRRGYVAHDKTVDIYMKGEWLVGENRVCAGIQSFGDEKPPKELEALFCPVGADVKNPHNISVTFWGRIHRPDITAAEESRATKGAWRCTRKPDSFICRAIN
jgi:hypothetical protein